MPSNHTQFLDVVCMALLVSEKEARDLACPDGPEDTSMYRVEWDGTPMRWGDWVPPTEVPALLRLGRHLWLVDWQSELEHSAIPLTEE